MRIDWVKYATVEEFISRLAIMAITIGNGTQEIYNYKGRLCVIYASSADNVIVHYADGQMDAAIYEYDIKSKTSIKVQEMTKTDRMYYTVSAPVVHTILDDVATPGIRPPYPQ